VWGLVVLLGALERWVNDFPPVVSAGAPNRFGNRAFRDWHARVAAAAPGILRNLPVPHSARAEAAEAAAAPAGGGSGGGGGASSIRCGEGSGDDDVPGAAWTAAYGNAEEELTAYLVGSFGDPTRIDYGTGHETAFLALLYCLAKLGVLGPDDAPDMVRLSFSKANELR